MRSFNVLFFTALALTLFAGCSEKAPTADKAETAAAEEAVSADKEKTTASAEDGTAASCTVKMNVEGMACGVGCPPVVKKTLMAVEGVNDVTVSFEESLATIEATGKACEENAHEAMIEALKVKDYTGTLKVADPEGVKTEQDPT